MTTETLKQNANIKKDIDSFVASSPAYRALAVSVYPDRYDPRVDERMTSAVEGLSKIAESDYELFSELKSLGVDMVHGSISWNLGGTLEYGLVPSGLMRQLGIVALGRETISNPHLREDVYAVTLDSAQETIRYADMRASGNNSEAISLESYRALIDNAEVIANHGINAFESIFRALYEDAYALKSRIDSGEIDGSVSPYPVVYGISSGKLADETLTATDSHVISNEIAIGGRIPISGIRAIFVPEEYVDQMQVEVRRHLLDWRVIAIERLRLMTATE